MKIMDRTKKQNYDFIVITNYNRVMFFKYSARFRIKKDLRNDIFLNEKITRDINTINKFLNNYQVVATLEESIGNLEFYKIITCDRYLRNKKILENKTKKFKEVLPDNYYHQTTKIDKNIDNNDSDKNKAPLKIRFSLSDTNNSENNTTLDLSDLD